MAWSKDVLDRLFNDLKSKNDDIRKKAAIAIRQLVDSTYRDLPSSAFILHYNEVIARISALVHGNDTNERLGGIYALDHLIEFKGDDSGQKITRFNSYLRYVLRGTDTFAMIAAAKALGRLAVGGGTIGAEMVESEVKSSLEMLQNEKQETRRLSAALVLKELARNSPTLVFFWITQILEYIWIALRDPKIVIREAGADAIAACIEIVSSREGEQKQKGLARVYEEALKGINSTNPDVIHGSLLVLIQLLVKGGMYMQGPRYREVCELILRYKDHREVLIRREVINMIPVLAAYTPPEFTTNYLHQCMLHLQGLLKREKDRNLAFVAIGKVASAVGSSIAPYLESILGHVKEGLAMKAKNKAIQDAPIFECLSMISIAVGQALSKHMISLLDPVFNCGLSEPLTQALVDMAHYIPPAKPIIQEKLLDLLSQVLSGRPFMPLGSPYHSQNMPQIWTRDHKDELTILTKENEIALALQTLGNFDFAGHILNEFVRDVAIRYVEADNTVIRKAAAMTCCQLFVRDPIVHQTSHHAIAVVGDVVKKLLEVGIGDVDADIRETVLRSLDTRFDRHLGKARNIRTLFLALNDEVFQIREAAITIIGRLTGVNPAYVFPSLRKVLVQLLTDIEYANSVRTKEDSARLISRLICASSTLIKPYVQPIVEVLLQKARDPHPELASVTLEAIGNLAEMGGEDMLKFMPDLMKILTDNLQDLSSDAKRIAALHTLGQVALSCGYVIEPYRDHPVILTILKNIITTEPPGALRKQAVKLIGILGAIDPDEQEKLAESAGDNKAVADSQTVTDVSLIISGITPANDEYYPTVVINTLIGLLKDASLTQYHSSVVDAVMTIYQTMGLKCVNFLGQVIPSFLTVIRAGTPSAAESYFNHLSKLVRIVRQHIRPYLHPVIDAIKEFWHKTPGLHSTMLSLIESIAKALEGEFKVFLADLLPLMFALFETDSSTKRQPTLRVLHAFLIFGSSAEEFMHLIIPAMVKMFDSKSQPSFVRKAAMETIGRLSRRVNISEFSSKIIHPLGRVLSGNDLTLKQTALETLSALIFQLGEDYLHFIPTINKILVANKVPHNNYALIVSKLQKGEPLPQDLSPDKYYGDVEDDDIVADVQSKKLTVNQQHLKAAWEASQNSTREDWVEWMRRFSVELLRESPHQALRACSQLASNYHTVARVLFNSAFVSCWTELYDQYQEELVHAIETALTSQDISPEIIQSLLNLAEFMERNDTALPIDVRTLGLYAAKCHAFAKALHYKELEFTAEQNPGSVEALIRINNQLNQYDASLGILRKARHYTDVDFKETWYEKLFRWDEALESYEKREEEEGETFETTMGKMRCLHALGEWENLSTLAQDKWIQANSDIRKAIAPLAAAAAWGLGQWELMDNYLSVMKTSSPDRAFFGAILAIHRNQFDDAYMHIEKARTLLETELTPLLGEAYARAYYQVLRVQMLAELEEIMIYKQHSNDPERLASLRNTWMKRLRGCEANPEVWQRMLKVRALVISPKDNMEMWIKFTNLCRKNQRMGLAEKSLNSLLSSNEKIGDFIHTNGIFEASYPVAYATFKYIWATGDRRNALDALKRFSARVSDDLQIKSKELSLKHREPHVNGSTIIEGRNDFVNPPITHKPSQEQKQLVEDYKLLSRCYLKMGEWNTVLLDGDWQQQDAVQDILASCHAATKYNGDWYRAWHAWALANFEVVTSHTSPTSHGDRENVDLPHSMIQSHVVPAIEGFFKSISLSSTSSLQDTLRLLTLWFAHGSHQEVNVAVSEGVGTVKVDTWLEVIPQLLARINQPNQRVRSSIHKLINEVGRAHPQAMVFPLTVAMKSDGSRRSRPAAQLMDSMRQHSPVLVEQADLVSHELIRIAVLWHEQWHEGLEEASRLYFGDHNIQAMFETLAPLHAMLERGAETLREISFNQSFGQQLREAQNWCRSFKNSQDIADLNQAWDLYYQVFRKITRQLPSLMSLEMQYVSPKLKEVHDLQLAVPGTYQCNKPIIRISKFDSVATVIQSKQRPRKLLLYGNDGNSYQYLLKGHEDIRQDERVMQLFALCNTLLANDTECQKRHLDIQRYAAIPLSTQSGLLGWVPNSDTMHVLIREYRESRKILLNIEHRIMLQMAPDYDSLTLMQKVEVFGYALDNTTGQDLYRVLWLKSKSSEAWLGRRTNYTRSLATMSMVGYILGLGDRHPSNLMLDRITGKVVHIDFGDCFEVAMHREKFPERVPFRLTRMLTYAMEVSNIEGTYRTVCEHVMRVLRQNKESVMAVLEAFIHDPLLTWRLNNRESPTGPGIDLVAANGIQLPPGVTAPNAPGTSNPHTEMMQAAGAPPGGRRPSLLATMEAANRRPGEEDFMPTSGRPDTGRTRHRASSAAVRGRPSNGTGSTNNGASGPGAVDEAAEARETQNQRAMEVLARVKEKLTGRDFRPTAGETGTAGGVSAEASRRESVLNHALTNPRDGGVALDAIHAGGGGGGGLDGMGAMATNGQSSVNNNTMESLRVDAQVDKLIREATNLENLSQHYIGWCSFW